MNWVLYYDTRYCNLNLLCPRYNYPTEGGFSFTVRSVKDWNYIPRSLRVLHSYSRFKKGLFKKFLVTRFFKSGIQKWYETLGVYVSLIAPIVNFSKLYLPFVAAFNQLLLFSLQGFSVFLSLSMRNFLPLTANLLNLNLYLSVQL